MANFLYGHRRMKQQFVYAGFILCLVPCASSNSDWTNHLSYENIFSTNNTRYVQIQQRPRPYNIEHVDHIDHISSYDNSKFNINEDTKGNDIEYEGEGEYKEKLLVGFSRDPFRYSIPEDDYLKGVRNMSPNTYSGKGERGKRGVLHLYNMIYCATGCEPLSYKGYGCYCGFLGSGRATDGIDRCCQMHDKCYENIYCPFFTTYFQPYYWKCYHNQPLCALENHQNTNNFINSCAGKLCECDRQFAMCVRRYRCPRRRALCRSSPLRLLQNLLMFK